MLATRASSADGTEIVTTQTLEVPPVP
jgi:hypothetical protein